MPRRGACDLASDRRHPRRGRGIARSACADHAQARWFQRQPVPAALSGQLPKRSSPAARPGPPHSATAVPPLRAPRRRPACVVRHCSAVAAHAPSVSLFPQGCRGLVTFRALSPPNALSACQVRRPAQPLPPLRRCAGRRGRRCRALGRAWCLGAFLPRRSACCAACCRVAVCAAPHCTAPCAAARHTAAPAARLTRAVPCVCSPRTESALPAHTADRPRRVLSRRVRRRLRRCGAARRVPAQRVRLLAA